jgi:hypothetical protein
MGRQDVIIYGYFETPLWPDPPGDATPDPQRVAAVAGVPSPVVSAPIGALVPMFDEVPVTGWVWDATIQGIVSQSVALNVPVELVASIDEPLVDTSGGGAVATAVVAVASIPAPAVSISGGGAVFGGNFGGTF